MSTPSDELANYGAVGMVHANSARVSHQHTMSDITDMIDISDTVFSYNGTATKDSQSIYVGTTIPRGMYLIDASITANKASSYAAIELRLSSSGSSYTFPRISSQTVNTSYGITAAMTGTGTSATAGPLFLYVPSSLKLGTSSPCMLVYLGSSTSLTSATVDAKITLRKLL